MNVGELTEDFIGKLEEGVYTAFQLKIKFHVLFCLFLFLLMHQLGTPLSKDYQDQYVHRITTPFLPYLCEII